LSARKINLNTLDPQIKETVVGLNELQSVLGRFGSASNAAGMFVEFGNTISKVIND